MHGRDQQAASSKVDEAGSTRRHNPSPQGVATSDPSPGHPQADRRGYDPVHAAYIFVHHITSVFSENVSRLPEMRTYAQEVGRPRRNTCPRVHR